MRTIVSLSVVVLLACGGTAQEPQPVKPGKEHEKLKVMEGTWDAVVKSMGSESKGVMSYKMGLGGLWLLEHFQGVFGEQKFEGRGLTSYDPQKKKYISIWVDSWSATPMISEGDYDTAGRMVMKGQMPMPDGKTVPITMVSEMKDKNNMVFVMTTDGDSKEMMRITYTRKLVKKKTAD